MSHCYTILWVKWTVKRLNEGRLVLNMNTKNYEEKKRRELRHLALTGEKKVWNEWRQFIFSSFFFGVIVMFNVHLFIYLSVAWILMCHFSLCFIDCLHLSVINRSWWGPCKLDRHHRQINLPVRMAAAVFATAKKE